MGYFSNLASTRRTSTSGREDRSYPSRRETLEYYLEDYKKRKDTLSKKEQDTLRDMRVVQEMYARGYEFMPVDLYKAQAHRFQIIDGKLMPALDTIDGLGDKAADAVVLAAMDGQTLAKGTFPMAQYGRVEHLGGELFNKKFTTHVWISPLTGGVEKIDAVRPE